MMKRAILVAIAVLSGAGTAFASSLLFLTMKEARRQANIFARHVAIKANDDGYRVGSCSRFSSVNVHCSAHNWGYRPNKGYEYDCYYTIVVRLTTTTIYRSQRGNRCHVR
jgi:hypothetical protein